MNYFSNACRTLMTASLISALVGCGGPDLSTPKQRQGLTCLRCAATTKATLVKLLDTSIYSTEQALDTAKVVAWSDAAICARHAGNVSGLKFEKTIPHQGFKNGVVVPTTVTFGDGWIYPMRIYVRQVDGRWLRHFG